MKQPELKANERELIKLIRFFSKRAKLLIDKGQLDPEHEKLTSACENLEQQLYTHAQNRGVILEKRARLEKVVEDNAQCPQCKHADMLKRTGTTSNEHGWRCNTYKCRRCNITFTWNRPNNPWHLVEFLEVYMKELEITLETEQSPAMREHILQSIAQMQESLNRLRPVLADSNEEVTALDQKEQEMTRLIHQFKNYLLIEKIKLDTLEEPEI
jgi:molybdopterin-biosynthesis enzyme MoeA-like protein